MMVGVTVALIPRAMLALMASVVTFYSLFNRSFCWLVLVSDGVILGRYRDDVGNGEAGA